jgi:hypothetical protein
MGWEESGETLPKEVHEKEVEYLLSQHLWSLLKILSPPAPQ